LQIFTGGGFANANYVTTIYSTILIGSGGVASQNLSYTSTTGNDITGVRLGAQHDESGNSGLAMFAEFDNLSFNHYSDFASGQFAATAETNPTPGGGGNTGGDGTPVPEPASIVLFGSALMGLVAGRKRFSR
jgi:hypothetical protein